MSEFFGVGFGAVSSVSIKMDENAYASMFSARGQVGTFTRALAQATAATAKVMAPRRTGKLAASIRSQQSRISGRFSSGYEVVARMPYAVFVHEGTRPHVIEGNPLLVFDWPKAGMFPAVFRKVNHPGTKAQPFLVNAMKAEMRAKRL